MKSTASMVRGFASVIVVAAASSASAQPRPVAPPLVGVTEVIKLTTPAGFIDDVVTADGDRFGYVIADSASKAELHVVSLRRKQRAGRRPRADHAASDRGAARRRARIRRSESTTASRSARSSSSRRQAQGRKAVYKIAPATHITVITRDGKPRIAVHRVTVDAHEHAPRDRDPRARDTAAASVPHARSSSASAIRQSPQAARVPRQPLERRLDPGPRHQGRRVGPQGEPADARRRGDVRSRHRQARRPNADRRPVRAAPAVRGTRGDRRQRRVAGSGGREPPRSRAPRLGQQGPARVARRQASADRARSAARDLRHRSPCRAASPPMARCGSR